MDHNQQIDWQHRIFSDFKHRKIHADICLLWRPGAGGNFIGSALGNDNTQLSGCNEYLTEHVLAEFEPSAKLNNFDELVFNLDLDDLYQMASCDRTFSSGDSVSTKLFKGHLPPMLHMRIYDCDFDEIASVDTASEDLWLLRMLTFYKSMLNSDYANKPGLMSEFVGEVDRAVVPWSAHTAMCTMLDQSGFTLPVPHTILMWKYLSACFRYDTNHLDMERFISFSNDFLMDRLRMSGYLESRTIQSEFYKQSMEYCRHHAKVFTSVDYMQFFFDLQMPTRGMLSRIDPMVVHAYSLGNLQLLDQLSQVIDTRHETGSNLAKKIAQLHERLALARERL